MVEVGRVGRTLLFTVPAADGFSGLPFFSTGLLLTRLWRKSVGLRKIFS